MPRFPVPPAPKGRFDPRTLRFTDARLEAEFRSEYGPGALASIRRSILVSMVLWTIVVVLLPLVARENVDKARAFTLGAMLPLIVGLALTRWFRGFVAVQIIAFVANVSGALVIFPLSIATRTFDSYAVAGTMLSTVFAFFFNRMAFTTASLATAVYLIAFGVARVLYGEASVGARIFDATLVYTTAGVSALTAYLLEKTSREVFRQRRVIEAQQQELAREKEKTDRLLHSILPASIVARLKDDQTSVADAFDEATVLFADLVGFTALAAAMPAARLVELLDGIFSRFDELSTRYQLEKIKTIGDAYMVVGGVPRRRPDHAEAVARMALDIIVVVAEVARVTALPLRVRIGIHSGPVVAGVIGRQKFSYDLWGDTVNLASRMESTGVAGAVQLSAATRARLPSAFSPEERGEIDVKGMGVVSTYLLRPEA